MTNWLFFVVAFLAGAVIAVQVGANTRLKEAFGEALPAVILSSLFGVVLLLAVMTFAGVPWPSAGALGDAPWWAWLGGPLGAAYAIATVLLARHLGAATLVGLVVTGQLVCSVFLDHFGVLGFTEHSLSAGRIVGCALMLAGIVLISRF
jgi:transporter family-2 protein